MRNATLQLVIFAGGLVALWFIYNREEPAPVFQESTNPTIYMSGMDTGTRDAYADCMAIVDESESIEQARAKVRQRYHEHLNHMATAGLSP